jgi:ADP-heptose:LPS heptosyltransferase
MVRKIAVLRANALGDFVSVLPALQALRETFPDSEIVYLGRHWHKEFLKDRESPIDRVIVVPPYPGISESESFIPGGEVSDDFFSAMQKEKFDIALQMHDTGCNSNQFLLKLGAKLTVGLQSPDAPALDISIPDIYYFNESMRYLEMVARVGAKTRYIQPDLSVIESDVAEAFNVLANPCNKPIALVDPGASDARRRWPPENFAQLVDFLIYAGYHVCLTGLDGEREVINAVIASVHNKEKVQDLCGKLSLAGMVGITSLSDIVVSNDTVTLDVARAVQTPNVGIFWCGNIVNPLPKPTGLNINLLSWNLHCPVCNVSSFSFDETESDCKHDTSFVAEIPVDEVTDAVKELIDLKRDWKKDDYRVAI